MNITYKELIGEAIKSLETVNPKQQVMDRLGIN